LKASDIKNGFDQLFQLEMKATIDIVKQAEKEKDDEKKIMGHSYLMGLKRAKEMIHIVLDHWQD